MASITWHIVASITWKRDSAACGNDFNFIPWDKSKLLLSWNSETMHILARNDYSLQQKWTSAHNFDETDGLLQENFPKHLKYTHSVFTVQFPFSVFYNSPIHCILQRNLTLEGAIDLVGIKHVSSLLGMWSVAFDYSQKFANMLMKTREWNPSSKILVSFEVVHKTNTVVMNQLAGNRSKVAFYGTTNY